MRSLVPSESNVFLFAEVRGRKNKEFQMHGMILPHIMEHDD